MAGWIDWTQQLLGTEGTLTDFGLRAGVDVQASAWNVII